MSHRIPLRFVVVISSDIEWEEACDLFGITRWEKSPMGEWLIRDYVTGSAPVPEPVLFFHGGWGKVAAAASTQYLIDRYNPVVLLNIGTCGGFAGSIEPEKIILAERTIIYDIIEQMGDQDEHIRHYTTDIDLSWLQQPYPQDVIRSVILSADRDILCSEVPHLQKHFQASVADWESGSIAWVCGRNNTRCLILRGVTDLVSEKGGEAYGSSLDFFRSKARLSLCQLLDTLPEWLILIDDSLSS